MQIDDFEVKRFPAIETLGQNLSLADPDAPHRLRVCIVTEEIIGPVRNGGIASTYYHLSKGLAAHGHEVHVLFLKGPVVEDETPEHWVRHFAEFGVVLHYLEVAETPSWGVAVESQERFVAAYRWLRDQVPFDVVHTSEWRGGALYALMAKRLGLAFEDTLFLVKTSSPYIWNRHYQMQPIARRELVLTTYAEKKCVELADAVIGGSAHLITFMEQIGYRLPPANVFVQPNIVDFSNVPVTDQRPPRAPGDVVKTQELVFFGRLEGRKGIELMCNALDILKERGIAPERVTFLGKWGVPLATQGGMQVADYIRAKSANWAFPVEIVTDRNQPEALSYMCARDMIAVMPSLIENSTMAVYETLEKNIPFIATAVGGTPELIDPADHAACLVAPKAVALADRLEAALGQGQVIARPSFSNDENLRIWYGFHAHVAARIAEQGRAGAIAALTEGVDRPGSAVGTLSYVVLLRANEAPDRLVAALMADPPDAVILGINDVSMRAPAQAAVATLKAAGIAAQVVESIGYAAGDALNRLVEAQQADAMVIAHGAGVFPRPGFLAAAKAALHQRPDALFTSFFAADGDVLGMPVGGDVASHFLTSRAYGPELFAMRAETRTRLGPFEPYDIRQGIVHEYVTRAVQAGPDDLLVFPEILLDWPQALEAVRGFADDAVYAYLKAKPLIDASNLAQRKITLTALQQTGGGAALGDGVLREGARPEDSMLWLLPSDWERDNAEAVLKRPLVLALDEAENTLWLYARGPGERRLKLRDITRPVELVDSIGPEGDENHITLSRFELPAIWEAGTSFPLSWGLYEGGHQQLSQFFRVNKLGQGTLSLMSRLGFLNRAAMDRVMALQRAAAALQAQQAGNSADGALTRLLETPAFQDDMARLNLEPLRGITAKGGFGRRSFETAYTRDEATLSKLLHLAQIAGREGLERALAQYRDGALRKRLGKRGTGAKTGNIRAHLAPPPKGGWGEADWLTGWVWDRDDPQKVLHVALMEGATVRFRARADQYIPEFGRRTPGLETHGFRIPVPRDLGDLCPAPGAVLRLVVWETGTPIRQAELIVRAQGDGGAIVLERQAGG